MAEFLVLILAAAFNRLWVGPNPLRGLLNDFEWWHGWLAWLREQPGAANLRPNGFTLIAIGVPPVAVGLIVFLAGASFSALWLIGALGVVVYCIDVSEADLRSSRLSRLARSAYADASEREQFDLRQRELIDHEFRALFPVVFWFALLGPGGALLYRLAVVHTERVVDEDLDDPVPDLLHLLEWIPVRIYGLCLTVGGSLADAGPVYSSYLTDLHASTEEALDDFVESALPDMMEVEALGQDMGQALGHLLRKALYLWVALFALTYFLL